jgi:hypothetical protein
MKRRIIESWLMLLYFDWVMHLCGFHRLHAVVREYSVRRRANGEDEAAKLCKAVDLACVFYFKRVMCLQRSAATTILLRRYGWKAELVIGAQLLPYESHAWVEVGDHVVNDKPYMAEIFQVLERC